VGEYRDQIDGTRVEFLDYRWKSAEECEQIAADLRAIARREELVDAGACDEATEHAKFWEARARLIRAAQE
jgi:hypothetical protein